MRADRPLELRDKFAMSVRQPLGVCGVITPWNFPMAIPSWKIIPALVCGNCGFKPATLTVVSPALRQDSREAGVPPGVVNMVTGAGGELARPSWRRRRSRRVVHWFHGGGPVGFEAVAPSFKKVHLEMGGKNVIMIMEDANLGWPSTAACGGFGTTGSAARPPVAWSCASAFIRLPGSLRDAGPRCGWGMGSIPVPRWDRRSVKDS
jgi:aldehyde dehydrogenase (NAD+)